MNKKSDQWQYWDNKSYELLVASRFIEAAQLCTRLLKEYPESEEALAARLVEAEYQLNNVSGMRNAWQGSKPVLSANDSALQKIAIVAAKHCDRDLFQSALQALLRLSPSDDDLAVVLARLEPALLSPLREEALNLLLGYEHEYYNALVSVLSICYRSGDESVALQFLTNSLGRFRTPLVAFEYCWACTLSNVQIDWNKLTMVLGNLEPREQYLVDVLLAVRDSRVVPSTGGSAIVLAQLLAEFSLGRPTNEGVIRSKIEDMSREEVESAREMIGQAAFMGFRFAAHDQGNRVELSKIGGSFGLLAGVALGAWRESV